MEYNLIFKDNVVKFISPKQKKNLNFIFEGSAQLKRFYFDGKLLIFYQNFTCMMKNL